MSLPPYTLHNYREHVQKTIREHPRGTCIIDSKPNDGVVRDYNMIERGFLRFAAYPHAVTFNGPTKYSYCEFYPANAVVEVMPYPYKNGHAAAGSVECAGWATVSTWVRSMFG